MAGCTRERAPATDRADGRGEGLPRDREAMGYDAANDVALRAAWTRRDISSRQRKGVGAGHGAFWSGPGGRLEQQASAVQSSCGRRPRGSARGDDEDEDLRSLGTGGVCNDDK